MGQQIEGDHCGVAKVTLKQVLLAKLHAIAVYAAKAFATKVGLNTTTRIFEVKGARSTAASYGFDRYWRDLRTFTLHDPVDYKLRDIGNWVVNHQLPMVAQYS